jgi:hypothetical protein
MIEEQQSEEFEPIFEKPNRGERIKRSIAARHRRKEVKMILEEHSYKDEKDARERLMAKRRLEKQKKRARRNRLTSSSQ